MNKIYLYGLLFAVLIGVLFSPFASSFPDGLEKTGEKLHFIHKAIEKPIVKSPFSDYQVPGVKNEKISTSLSGLIGTLLTFLIVYFIVLVIFKVRK